MLIIDMPMPKFCIWRDDKNEPHRCPLLNEDDDCVLQDSNIWMGWNEQYAHCPIKGELPDEHGDLIEMSRYIDADALKEIIMDMRNHAEPSPCLPHQTMLIPDRMVCDKIDAMQTVDAVPVVRCQRCKHYCGEETYTNHRICKIWNEEVFANGYCYHGERKDGERR